MEQKIGNEKRVVARRIKMTFMFLCSCALLFVFYIIGIQLSSDVKRSYNELVRKEIMDTVAIDAHRGSIYARDGRVLATSITRKTLYIDFGSERFDNYERYKKNADTLARGLAAFFKDRSARSYYEDLIKWRNASIKQRDDIYIRKMPKWKFWADDKQCTTKIVTKRRHFNKRIFRDVDINEWYEIRKLPLLRRGLDVTYSTTDHDYRVYPQGDIAEHTIGRYEPKRSKRHGIEYAMRDTLAGKKGVQVMQTISPGYVTRVDSRVNVEPMDGYDVVTTLDVDVQDVADNALAEQLVKENAIWGVTMVMECATGDILAMVNLRRDGERCVEDNDYALSVPINPGSTFKIVSAMGLLEKGVPESKIYFSGLGKTQRVGGKKGAYVTDSHPISPETKGRIDMRTAFAESANVYFTQAVFDAFQDNPKEFSDLCRRLHLHEKVGLEYLHQRPTNVPVLDKRHTSRYNALVNMAYGYNLDITPLHTLTLYNAVANGGVMVAPRLILRTERDGEVVNEAPVRILEEQITTPTVLATLRSFMEDVSRVGTAEAYFGAEQCSFTSGSKTGTAQVNTTIHGVRYRKEDKYYYGSMVTYLPADVPRYTILTAIFTKRQKKKAYYGAGLAGPVQKTVATFLHNRGKQYAEESEHEKQCATQIKGGNIAKIREVASEYGNDYTSTSRRGWGSSTVVGDNKLHISQIQVSEGVVPNVVGMGLDDALYLLERSGMEVEIRGYGVVAEQSVAAGTEVGDTNRKILIELR